MWNPRIVSVAALYAEFATREARVASPTYERVSLAVSEDAELLTLLERVPAPKRQPNLLFAVVRLLGGPVNDVDAFHDFTVAYWPAVEVELRSRAMQTNEIGRCALLPVLAGLPQPLALLEVGAAAGLGLYPDRYSYRYGEHRIGTSGAGRVPPSGVADHAENAQVKSTGHGISALLVYQPATLAREGYLPPVGCSQQVDLEHDRLHHAVGHDRGPVLDCALTGIAPPNRLPEVVWRAGLELNPLDVADPADLAWLEALVWPEQHERRERLRAAASIATEDPPTLIRGDLVDDLARLAAQAPDDVTLVVFHTSVLYQVPAARRTLSQYRPPHARLRSASSCYLPKPLLLAPQRSTTVAPPPRCYPRVE